MPNRVRERRAAPTVAWIGIHALVDEVFDHFGLAFGRCQMYLALLAGKSDLEGHQRKQQRDCGKPLAGKQNPRYVVTSLEAENWPAQQLYEDLYCERGEAENRIKEQLSLFADRRSSETLRANQLRLYLSTLAYVLMVELGRTERSGGCC